MKKSFLSLICFLLVATPVHAMENGYSAEGNKRVIALHQAGMTGFLYDDRIVFTNAHSVFARDGKPFPDSFWMVSNPGVKTWAQESYAKVVKIFVANGYSDWNPRRDWTRKNDFAIFILDRPVANVEKAALADQAQINQLRDSGALVTTAGYGYQSKEDRNKDYSNSPRIVEPKKATLKMASGNYLPDAIQKHIAARTIDANRGPFPEELEYHLLAPVGGPGTCDNDSGSGFWVESKNELVYLGTMGAHLGITNCGNDQPVQGLTPLIGITPVYPFLDLVKEAEEWVRQNPTDGFVETRSHTVPKFVGNSTAVTKSTKNWLKFRLDSSLGYSQVSCTGLYTKPSDAKLALKRAQSICKEVGIQYGDWKQTVKTQQAKNRNQSGQVVVRLTE